MPWTQAEATERLTPPPGLPGLSPADWIEIKTTMTADLRQKLFKSSFDVNIGGDNGAANVNASMDIFAYRSRLLELIVMAWSDPSPPTPEALASLHPDVQDWIAKEFENRGGEVTEAQMGEGSTPST